MALVRWSQGWRLVRSPGEPKARPVKAYKSYYERATCGTPPTHHTATPVDGAVSGLARNESQLPPELLRAVQGAYMLAEIGFPLSEIPVDTSQCEIFNGHAFWWREGWCRVKLLDDSSELHREDAPPLSGIDDKHIELRASGVGLPDYNDFRSPTIH